MCDFETEEEDKSVTLHHIIEAQQFDVPTLRRLFEVAEQMEKVVERGGITDYHNRIMATLFYEPSTRTRFSFETAAVQVCPGGGCILSSSPYTCLSRITRSYSSDKIKKASILH